MFRKMRRFKQQLSDEQCIHVLNTAPRGVLSVLGEDGYPYGLPINYVYNEEDGKIYFHGAKEGHKIDAIRKYDKVSFCVYDEGFRKEGEWALNIASVICFGRISFVTDEEKAIAMVRKLARRYYPSLESADEEVRKDGHRAQMLALTIDHMTGKLVNES